MSRNKIMVLLLKLRGCLMQQEYGECCGNCKNCMYATHSKELIEMLDELIFMYSYIIKKKEAKKWKWFWKREKK